MQNGGHFWHYFVLFLFVFCYTNFKHIAKISFPYCMIEEKTQTSHLKLEYVVVFFSHFFLHMIMMYIWVQFKMFFYSSTWDGIRALLSLHVTSFAWLFIARLCYSHTQLSPSHYTSCYFGSSSVRALMCRNSFSEWKEIQYSPTRVYFTKYESSENENWHLVYKL